MTKCHYEHKQYNPPHPIPQLNLLREFDLSDQLNQPYIGKKLSN